MKYLVGLIGLIAIFAAYTSIVLVRYSYVQAASLDFEHAVMVCFTNMDSEGCVHAQEKKDKLDAVVQAVGKAPKLYRMFVPDEALK